MKQYCVVFVKVNISETSHGNMEFFFTYIQTEHEERAYSLGLRTAMESNPSFFLLSKGESIDGIAIELPEPNDSGCIHNNLKKEFICDAAKQYAFTQDAASAVKKAQQLAHELETQEWNYWP